MKEQQTTKAINVEGLPQPVTHALQAMIQALKGQLHVVPKRPQAGELKDRPGKVIGKLTRKEIYEDAL